MRQLAIPFVVGVAVGVLLHKNWPKIREVLSPRVRDAVRGGSNLAARTREAIHEQGEKFSDLVAEIREAEEAKAKAGVTPAPTTDPAGA